MSVTLDDVEAAATRLRGRIQRTPCTVTPLLGKLTGREVFCKREQLQVTGSFKERGAANRLLLLTPEEARRGVVAASAGNHALGLSYHGRELGVPVTVVMPVRAPLVKVEQCRTYGARVVLHGDSFDEAKRHAEELSRAEHFTLVHSFDDPQVIAGQGTIALEILEQAPALDALLVPVGGGGLLAGLAVALSAKNPSLELIGVEAEHAPTLTSALAAGHPSRIETEPSLADGLSVAELGALPFEILRASSVRTLLVSEGAIAQAIVRLMELEKTIVEGAGAVGLAALLQHPEAVSGKRVGLVLSGGNIDLSVVSRIIERGLAAQGRVCRLNVELEDHPGSLAALTRLVARTGANVQQIDHDRNFGPADVSLVTVRLVLQTRDHAHIDQIEAALDAEGLRWSR
jgi:threonine dehydratase